MKNMHEQGQAITRPTQANIETVARLEEEFLEQRSLTDRIGDAVGGFAGSMTFVLVHLVWFVMWLAVNTSRLPAIRPFDPFPFVLLTMIVSMEGVLLATFVLMKQNRMSRRADQRAHLNLQIDLLAEKEVTKMLQLQLMLCDHLGVKQARDREVSELSADTAVERLARELKRKLPEE